MTTVFATSNWDKATAIGTIAVAFVAASVAALPALVRWLRRPRLMLSASDTEPHCVGVPGSGPGIEMVGTVHLRVGVRNVGHSVAMRAWATVNRRWRRDVPVDDDLPDQIPKPYVDERWALTDDEPVTMRWASGANPDGSITIPADQTQFIELAVLKPKALRLTLSAISPAVVLGGVVVNHVHGRHRWELFVGADDSSVRQEVIEFVVDGRNFVSEVSLTSPPERFEDHRLLRLLSDLAHGDGDEPGVDLEQQD